MGQEIKPGLRSTIMLIATSVVILASLAVTGALSLTFNSHHFKAMQSRSVAIAKSLSLQAERLTALGLNIDEIVGFEVQCAETISSYPDTQLAMVTTPDGRVLFHSDKNQIGKTISAPLLQAALQQDSTTTIDTPVDDVYYAVDPIRSPTGTHLGSVAIGFAREQVDADLRQLLVTGVVAGLVIAVSGLIVLFLMLNRFVIRPITSLVEVFDRLRNTPGDYSFRAPDHGDDEIGVMVEGFNDLLNQIESREKDITAAREASDRANKAKSDFLAAMSHDLRTPMHAVLSMNELMLGTELSEKQRRYAQNTQRAGHQLMGIINDILAYARIESGKLELDMQDFDLQVLVNDVIQLQIEFAHQKKLTLDGLVADDLPVALVGDGPRITQMLTNLLNNAIKFTDEGHIHVSVMRSGKHVVFSVTDSGIGIDPDKIKLLFQPFTQIVTPTAQRRSGTGLGLSIVKQLAEAMGGGVGVESTPGRGTTFWFSIRLQFPSSTGAHRDGDGNRRGVELSDPSS